MAVIDPNSILGVKVIADVNVRRAVAIDIVEHDRERPVIGHGDRAAVLTEKRPVRPTERKEPALPVVAVKPIRFAVFQNAGNRIHSETPLQVGRGDRLSVHRQELELAIEGGDFEASIGFIPPGAGPVVGHIEVQKTIAIDVGQGQGGAAGVATQARRSGHIPETSLAVVQEQSNALADPVDQQVQVTITVDIREGGASRGLAGTRHTRGGRYLLESPMTQVAIERIGIVQTA